MAKLEDIKYNLNKETIDPEFAEGYFGEKKESTGSKKIPLINLLESIIGTSEIKSDEQVDKLLAELDKLPEDMSINSEDIMKILK